MAACGLDFGTSNTTLGHDGPAGPTLLPLEGTHRTIPSAIFFELGREPVIGRAATAAYVCVFYTSGAAGDTACVDVGGRRMV